MWHCPIASAWRSATKDFQYMSSKSLATKTEEEEGSSKSCAVAYDSDQEPQSETAVWRLDPEESHSDRKTDVVYENEKGETKTDSYHVQKYALAVRPGKSEYFC